MLENFKKVLFQFINLLNKNIAKIEITKMKRKKGEMITSQLLLTSC